MTFKLFKDAIVATQTNDWTAKRKKFKLKFKPETTYLLVIVIKMDEKQYAMIDIGPELTMLLANVWLLPNCGELDFSILL